MKALYGNIASYKARSVGVEIIGHSNPKDKSFSGLIKAKVPVKLDMNPAHARLADNGAKAAGSGAVQPAKKADSVQAFAAAGFNLKAVMADETVLPKIIHGCGTYKRNLIFEMPLGYGSKKVAELSKAKINMSVYIPYGKDWVPYALNRPVGGRMKRIAITVLAGQHEKRV
jgi:hypothetical protein